jgi:GntR family transcriptional repressor for pyruvate dehydrogenase complex
MVRPLGGLDLGGGVIIEATHHQVVGTGVGARLTYARWHERGDNSSRCARKHSMVNMENSTFVPVNRVRSVDEVVAQLRDAVASGRVGSGQRLPSERELSESFAVSRATVREALRSLEAIGIVNIKLGSSGGAFAIAPNPKLMGQALATMLLFEGATGHDLDEFRLTFEQENAYLAATRATTEHRREIVTLLARTRAAAPGKRGWTELEDVDFDLHQILAIATANSVRVAIAIGIHYAVRRSFDRIEPQPATPAMLRRDILNVASAVLDADRNQAATSMERHMRRWVQATDDLSTRG